MRHLSTLFALSLLACQSTSGVDRDGGTAPPEDAHIEQDSAETLDGTTGGQGGEPVGGEPVGGEPVGGEPVGGEPVGGEPVGGEPVGGEPVGGAPDCDNPPVISMTLEDDHLYRRGEVATFALEADRPVTWSFSSERGGLFTVRGDRLHYSSGVTQLDAVPWPSFTGYVFIEGIARDANGCEAEVQGELSLAGDVLVGDGGRGQIVALGSGGQTLGSLYALPAPVRDLTVLPDGGIVAALKRTDALDGVRIVAIDFVTGRQDIFDAQDLAGEPLYPEGEGQADTEVNQIVYDPTTRLVWTDGGGGAKIHRFEPNGAYHSSVVIAPEESFYWGTLGFAVLADSVLVNRGNDGKIYRVRGDEVSLFLDLPGEVTAMTATLDGNLVVVTTQFSDATWTLYDGLTGRELVGREPNDLWAHEVSPFMTGYLTTYNSGHLDYLSAELALIDRESPDNPFPNQLRDEDIFWARGAVWLHDPVFPIERPRR